MRFLIDAQLPPALSRWLEAKGFDARHVEDLGLGSSPDTAIWKLAIETERIIVTKDEDFAVRRTLTSTGPQVIWIRWGNTTKSELLRRFTQIFETLVLAIQRGETLVELT